jgi:cytidine deaminase
MPIPASADLKRLLDRARKASLNAYAPCSGIRVGAAAKAASGKVYTGCNVENASLGLTICAERVAIQNAVAAGERQIVAVAVFSPDMKSITPCGACRQVMTEFAPPARPGLMVIMEGKNGPRAVALSRLMPEKFLHQRICSPNNNKTIIMPGSFAPRRGRT